jgi:hypothetical protein
MNRITHYQVLAIAALIVSCILPASAQSAVELQDGQSVKVNLRLDRGLRSLARNRNAATEGLPFYTANYTSFGQANVFNIVGTDPSLGTATTTIPTVLVPIKVVFSNTTLDGTDVVALTENSPIFLTTDFTTGGTDIGVTQYGDAIQRGEFWKLPGFSHSGYHVLLGTPTIAPTVTVTVPSKAAGQAFKLKDGKFIGALDPGFFDPIIERLVGSYTPNQLPIFLTDNVFEAPGAVLQNCCIGGYHASQGPPISTAQTWIYAVYTEPDTFKDNGFIDVVPLSHEVAEWLNDPFVGAFPPPGINLIPPAILPGQGSACIPNFETGDPLEALLPATWFTETTNGTVYHLQDEAFLSWYLHGPSFGVNGFYSYKGNFRTPSTLCGPG